MFRAALCVAAAVAVADAAGHDAVVGFEAPVEGLYAANADISPPTTATNASQCAARCLSTPGCISFNLCGTAAPFDCGVSAFNMSYVPGSAAECAWYRRVVERNDTRLGPLAVPWALVPPASGVALTGGPLADAFTNNIVQYLLTRDPADMLHFFALRAGRPLSNSSCYGWGGWIPGSEAGNFLMGGGSALRWLAPGAQPALAAAVAAVVDGIAEYASPNGWAWAFNESQIGDDNLPDYCAAWVIRGLLDSDAAGVPRALDVARATLDVFSNHTQLPFFMPPNGGPHPVQPFPDGFNNVTSGGYGTASGHMIYIQFQGMIKHTLMARSALGVQADLDIVRDLLQEEWWLRALLDGDLYRGLWHRTFFSHNYEITAFEAFLDMYVLTGNVSYLNAVDAAWTALRDNFVLPGGSMAINEGDYYPPKSYYIGFTGRNVASAHDHAAHAASDDGYYHAPCCTAPGGTCAAAPATHSEGAAASYQGPFATLRSGAKARGEGLGPNDGDPPTGELCGSVFWVFLNARLHRLRPDVSVYVDEMEAAALNIGVGALGLPGSGGQGPNGVGIRYFANMHKAKQFPSMHASCCEGQGTRLFGSLPEFVFSLGPAQLVVDLYAGSSISTIVPGVPGAPVVRLDVDTAWPVADAVAMTLTLPPGGAAVELDLALRMPSWLTAAVRVTVDGEAWPAVGVPGSYLHVSRAWAPGAHAVAFSLPAGFVVHPYAGASQLPPYARVGYSFGAVLLAAEGAWNATVDALVMPAGLDAADPGAWLAPRAGADLTWDVVVNGQPSGIFFKPYYAVQDAAEQFDVTASANPPLLTSGVPCALAGEWFILERRGVQVALEGAGADARVPATPGRLFLTTHRVVLVLDRASARGLVSLELPLGAVVGEPAFHQPVFTANNLSLLVAPAPGGGFAPAAAPRGAPPPSLPVRVFFTDGVGVLLPAFFGLLEATRRAAAAGDAAARARLAAPAAWVSSAFAGRDPSDPSILYLSQPVPPAPAVPLERQQPAVAGVAGPAPGAPTPPPGVSAGYYAAASAAGGAR